MRKRNNHKICVSKKLKFPRACVFLDTETTTIQEDEKEHRPKLVFGAAEFIVLDDEINIISYERQSFQVREDFWVKFYSFLSSEQIIHVYAHNWSFDFPVLNGLEVLPALGFKLTHQVTDCPPLILTFEGGRYKIKIVDTLNYYRSSLAEMGRSLGIQKLDMPDTSMYSEQLERYCLIDVEILRESMLSLMRFLHDNDICMLKYTLSSISLCSFIRKFSNQDIYIDADEKINEFGRKSYFGGRTEAFFIGRSEQEFYLIDVNSQYPYIMLNNVMPYKTVSIYNHLSIFDLTQLINAHSVTAEVLIDTDIAAYPYKINHRTCFPLGRFRTFLSTAEVEYALFHNHIRKVYRVVVYQHDYIFRKYVEYFYDLRKKYKKEGNEAWQKLCKILMNSLYGKFGQQAKEWEATDFEPKGFPHTEYIIDAQTGERFYIREVDNVVYICVKKTESNDSFPAIAAHVTAAARIMIQETIDKIGQENVYYCDTDSLLITHQGYHRIKDQLSETELGKWKVEDEYDFVDIRGLKDYQFESTSKIKGVGKKATQIGKNQYVQIQFASLAGVIQSRVVNAPLLRRITKTLRREYMKGTIHPDGRVVPFILLA
jgi:hypothetical protein